MPARSILSKHIPHLSAWSVSTAFLSYLDSRRSPDGVRPKTRCAPDPAITPEPHGGWSNSICCLLRCMNLLLALFEHHAMRDLSRECVAKRRPCTNPNSRAHALMAAMAAAK